MPKVKTHYVGVRTPDGPRLLFRWFVLKDSSFCLEIVPGSHLRDGTGTSENHSLKYQKFSLHPTPSNPEICTITFSQDGQNTKESHHIHSVSLAKGKMTHILSKRISNLHGPQYTPKSGKTVEEILAVDPRKECLTAYIYARLTGSDSSFADNGLFQSWSVSGGHFSIEVLFNRIPLPALNTSFLHKSMSSPKEGMFRRNKDGLIVGMSGVDDLTSFASSPTFLDRVLREDFFQDIAQRTLDPSRAYKLLSEIYDICGPTHGAFFNIRKRAAAQKMSSLSHLWTCEGN